MEENIRAKAIITKFNEDIKAAGVCHEAQISVLYTQLCLHNIQGFRKLVMSLSRCPLPGPR